MTDESPKKVSGAVLQFEIDRQRGRLFESPGALTSDRSWKYGRLLHAALDDTLNNGGTFVVVVDEHRITAVQHKNPHEFEAEAPTP